MTRWKTPSLAVDAENILPTARCTAMPSISLTRLRAPTPVPDAFTWAPPVHPTRGPGRSTAAVAGSPSARTSAASTAAAASTHVGSTAAPACEPPPLTLPPPPPAAAHLRVALRVTHAAAHPSGVAVVRIAPRQDLLRVR